MVLTFFFLLNCANTERRLRGVMWIMVIGGLFPALGTLKNYLTGNMYEGRAAWVGIFANPNEVAYALVILVPLAGLSGYAAGLVRAPADDGDFAALCGGHLRHLFARRVAGAGGGDRAGRVAEKEQAGLWS